VSVFRYDRRLGEGLRSAADGVRGGRPLARLIARAMSPVFQLAVGAAIADRGTRGTGIRMLIAGAGAATAARVLRDGIGRQRPGERANGGFPSRHAAAAGAISIAAGTRRPLLGLGLGAAALVGSLGRIASAEHEPADIVAGMALGALVGCLVAAPLVPARFALRGARIP